jgi:hypothetical protein
MSNNHQGQTSPKSVQGKLNIRFNALKSGIFARSPVLPFEDEMQYRRHVKAVMRSLEPEDAVQLAIAQQIADCMWRGTRFEYRAALQRDEIFKTLTPAMMVGLLGYKGLVAKYPARILLTPNLKVPSKDANQYADILQEFEHWLLQTNSAHRGFSSYMVESCLQKDMMVVNLKKYYTGFSLINPRTTDFVYFLETFGKEGFAVARNNEMFQPYNNRLKAVKKSKLLELIANGKHCEIRLNVLDNSHKCAFCEADGTCVDAITADGQWFTIGKECLSLAKCIVAFFEHLHHTFTHMRECDLSDCIKTMNKLLLEIMKN